MHYDVIIIGGSYAGLSAGLPLARARKRVLVIDNDQRRNRFGTHSHGFLTQDGTLASEIARIGKEQLLRYPTVDWLDGKVVRIDKHDDGFCVYSDVGDNTADTSCPSTSESKSLYASRIILATGVKDVLPDLSGLAERWGQKIFACPYCHGYELNQGRLGVLATSEFSLHSALMLPDWGDVTLFLQDAFVPSDEQLAQLATRHITLETRRVLAIEDELTLKLADGETVALDGLFIAAPFEQASALPQMLGCAMDETPLGNIIKVSDTKETSVAGVFACGDNTQFGTWSVPIAVADGMKTGVCVHRSLMFGL